MSILLDKLPDDPAELKRIIVQQQAERIELQNEYDAEKAELRSEYDAEVALLKEQIHILLHRHFGRSSEAAPGQGELFDEAEAENQAEPDSATEIEIRAHRRKRGGRKPLPDHLPRIDFVFELEEDERCCPHDGTQLVEIDEEVTEQLDYIPAQAIVRRIIRKKYACPCCDEYDIKDPFKSLSPG